MLFPLSSREQTGGVIAEERIRIFTTMRVTKPLAALALGTALALLTLEGVSRWYFNFASVRDPVLGLVVSAGHTVRSRIEGAGVAHYEDRGIRRAADIGPRTGTQILCLGDSFTEAHQVSDDAVYTTLVERSLNRAGVPAAILGFGGSGRSAADYVALAKLYKGAFTPTWIVVQMHDADFTSDAWNASKTHFRRVCPTCPIETVRSVDAPDDRVHQVTGWLRNRAALFGFARHRYQSLAGSPGGRGQPPDPGNKPTNSAKTFPVAEELRMLAEAYDGRLTLLLLGWFDPADPGRDTEGEALVRLAAHELGISIATSKDEYQALAEAGIAPHGFSNTSLNWGHMNAAGHAAAARVLTRELVRLHTLGRF